LTAIDEGKWNRFPRSFDFLAGEGLNACSTVERRCSVNSDYRDTGGRSLSRAPTIGLDRFQRMINCGMKEVADLQRHSSPTVTPQVLAWDGKELWISSRDLGTLYRAELDGLKIVEEIDPPGVVWAGVATNDGWRFTIGKGLNDDRYVYRYTAAEGFDRLFSCPELTGSYLSFDGEHLYLSQWYKERILKLDDKGDIQREIHVGAEICGHTFVDGMLYVLRGRENKDVPKKAEEWRIARLDPGEESPTMEDLAPIPFAARSLTFDGQRFWSNHRAANEIMSFTVPL
jgi:hypothetical protein